MKVQLLSVTFLWAASTRTVIPFQNLNPDAGLNIHELTAKYGYSTESHQVETEDGYLITMHRILHPSINTNRTKHPVLLMHGLLISSVDWVNMGPKNALGFLLVKEGYDVWLGNQRGNTWSRNHTSIDPDRNPERFFDFSFHEIGVYDLPAMIDYILETTGHVKLCYVGHSQGTTDFFIMASQRPRYNRKIKLMVALAPVAFLKNPQSPAIRLAVEKVDTIEFLIKTFNVHEFLPYRKFYSDIGAAFCNSASKFQEICTRFYETISGVPSKLDPNFIPVITSNAPAGSSIKQLRHYYQVISSGKFRQCDYGESENMVKYGRTTPPSYDISKITSPVSLYYGKYDWIVSIENIQLLAEKLPNLVNLRKLSFNHADFLWAKNIGALLNNDVIAEIESIR